MEYLRYDRTYRHEVHVNHLRLFEMFLFLRFVSQRVYQHWESSRTPVIAAKLRKRNAAANVFIVPIVLSTPTEHFVRSAVIFSRTNCWILAM
jgi:hypothetical protein